MKFNESIWGFGSVVCLGISVLLAFQVPEARADDCTTDCHEVERYIRDLAGSIACWEYAIPDCIGCPGATSNCLTNPYPSTTCQPYSSTNLVRPNTDCTACCPIAGFTLYEANVGARTGDDWVEVPAKGCYASWGCRWREWLSFQIIVIPGLCKVTNFTEFEHSHKRKKTGNLRRLAV